MSRPADGHAVILSPVAAIVWEALDGWTDVGRLVALLGTRFPDVDEAARTTAVVTALDLLTSEGLVERARV